MLYGGEGWSLKHRDTGRQPCEDGGRDCSDIAISQVMPGLLGTTRSRKWRNKKMCP